MSAKVEDKAVEVIDKVANAVDAMTAKLATLAEKYGPEAIDAGLAVVRINGAADLIVGVACVCVPVFALKRSAALFAQGRKLHRIWWRPETSSSEPDGIWQSVVGCLGIIGSALAGVVGATTLLNIWNWVAIFEPKLWVVKRLLGL